MNGQPPVIQSWVKGELAPLWDIDNVRDYADIGAGAALALAAFLALGLILHWFFFVCALPAFGLFVFTEWATARQQARGPGYRYNFDEDGNIEAIQCEHCGRASHNQHDIESKFCSFCGRYHKDNDNLKKTARGNLQS